MIRVCKIAVILLAAVASTAAQNVPRQLQGKWHIKRMLPAGGISCWSGKDAMRLIGTEIEYADGTVRWGMQLANIQSVEVSELTADQFYQEHSGSGGQVSLSQLGIQVAKVTQVSFKHAEVKPIQGTYGIVGEDAFIKDKNTIVIDPCGVYFEAVREPF